MLTRPPRASPTLWPPASAALQSRDHPGRRGRRGAEGRRGCLAFPSPCGIRLGPPITLWLRQGQGVRTGKQAEVSATRVMGWGQDGASALGGGVNNV